VELQHRALLETSLPKGAARLESILCTEQLRNRPSRPPNHAKENSALVALCSALADSPRTILQTLADEVLDVLSADSAGLSLLTKDGKWFYWAAIAGAWGPHLGEGTPRDFGPCGDVLDRNIPMLFSHWERRYPYLSVATPLADEGLLVPFYVNGKAVGTIWAIAHNDLRKFDAEDLRLLESMGRFASAAYQVVEAIEDLSVEITARAKAESELRELTNDLERQVRFRTEELERRNRQLAELAERVAKLADERRRIMADALDAEDRTREQISQLLHDEVLQSLLSARQDLAKTQRTARTGDDAVTQAREAIAQAIGELRNAVAALHPVTLAKGGLAAAIRATADIHARRGGFEVTLDVAPDAGGARDQLIVSLAQELLNNAARHARASHVSITLHRMAESLVFEVADDGCGMDAGRPGEALARGHVGLASIAMRVEACGGRFQLTTGDGEGTRVRVALPAGNSGRRA
jgi:signal transduction histidine kinase